LTWTGERIERLCTDLDCSFRDLARVLGVNPRRISNAVHGRARIPASVLVVLDALEALAADPGRRYWPPIVDVPLTETLSRWDGRRTTDHRDDDEWTDCPIGG
jgi:transcriptional regulator with XRE-family HTH domain